MKITIVNTLDCLSSDGSRVISACLRRAGFNTEMLFMIRPPSLCYSRRDVELFADRIKDSDLVMFSVFSNYSMRSGQLSQRARDMGKFTLWGGPHLLTPMPDVLDHCDAAGSAECETMVVDFARRFERAEDFSDLPNLLTRVNGRTVINPIGNRIEELDSLPFADFDTSSHWILDGDGLVPLDDQMLQKYFTVYAFEQTTYTTMSARGCPYACTFCDASVLKMIYNSQKLRMRSIGNLLDELKWVLERWPFFNSIFIADDDFLARSNADLQEFADRYPEEIGIPFGCCTHPNTLAARQKGFDLLTQCGLGKLQIGIQSGSDRTNRSLFIRRTDNRHLWNALEVATEVRERRKSNFSFMCDFIIDNPWEDDGDIRDTCELLLQLPRWCYPQVFHLVFLPGTEMYRKAVEEGLVADSESTYNEYFATDNPYMRMRYNKRYLYYVLKIIARNRAMVPQFMLRALIHPTTVASMNRIPTSWMETIFVDGILRFLRTIRFGVRINNLIKKFSWGHISARSTPNL